MRPAGAPAVDAEPEDRVDRWNRAKVWSYRYEVHGWPHPAPEPGAPPSAVLDPFPALRDDLTPGRYITAGEAIERAYRAPETYVLDVGTWARAFRHVQALGASARRDIRRSVRDRAHRSTRP